MDVASLAQAALNLIARAPITASETDIEMARAIRQFLGAIAAGQLRLVAPEPAKEGGHDSSKDR